MRREDVKVEKEGDVEYGGGRMARVEEVADREPGVTGRRCGEPVLVSGSAGTVPVEDVALVFRRRLVAPHGHRVDPRVHLEAGGVRRL